MKNSLVVGLAFAHQYIPSQKPPDLLCKPVWNRLLWNLSASTQSFKVKRIRQNGTLQRFLEGFIVCTENSLEKGTLQALFYLGREHLG